MTASTFIASAGGVVFRLILYLRELAMGIIWTLLIGFVVGVLAKDVDPGS